jgi:hypothetical protein
MHPMRGGSAIGAGDGREAFRFADGSAKQKQESVNECKRAGYDEELKEHPS